ncbi:MAG: hypothetical protein WBF52_17865 [Geitlerinemataceae cyanobacterium]
MSSPDESRKDIPKAANPNLNWGAGKDRGGNCDRARVSAILRSQRFDRGALWKR